MKKGIAVFVTLSLCFSLLLYPSHSVAASTDDSFLSTEEQIDLLFDELAQLRATELLNEDSFDYSERLAEIEDSLEKLGVKKLSDYELEDFFDSTASPETVSDDTVPVYQVTKPTNTDTLTWYLYNSPYQPYDYTDPDTDYYDIQRLIAVGNNAGGMLVTGEDNVLLYSNKKISISDILTTCFSIYIQKSIGGISTILAWTPYELLFSSTSSSNKAVFNTCYATHRCVSTIEYTYVKPANSSDSYYKICKYSNKLAIATNVHGAAVANSVATTYSLLKSYSISSTYYSNIQMAMYGYVNGSAYYDYIPSYTISAHDGAYTYTAYVPNPMVGPGQLY